MQKKLFIILLTIIILLTACTPKASKPNKESAKPSQSATASASATLSATDGVGESAKPDTTDEQLLMPTATSDDTQEDVQTSATASTTDGAVTTNSPSGTVTATSGTTSGTKAPAATSAPTATSKPSSTGSAATATKKPTTTATATVKPTATKKPTAKPTPTPQATKYYWSNAVTEYLTGDKNRFGCVGPTLEAVEVNKSTLSGTVFGKSAVGNYAGVWNTDGDTMYVESVNKNGVISQAYKNRWYDSDVYKWVDEKRVTGVYLDMNYSKPGVEPNTEIDWWLTQYQELVTYNVFGVKVTVEQNKTNDMAVNFYPLDTGDFVLDLGGVPVILNGIPETVLVRGGPTVNGLRDLQVSVNGHVVYEADWLGNSCRF